jgi:hypothetical protein
MSSEESSAPAPEGSDDALRKLSERLDRASESAERLIAEAAQRVSRPTPPAGWQQPDADGPERDRPESLLGAETDLLIGILGSLRDRIPPELQQRLADAVREVLLAIRALIDWYLERSERRRTEPAKVQDIPIL